MAKFVKVHDAATGSQKLNDHMVVPAAGLTLVTTTSTQTLTGKTLTSPTIEGATSSNGTFNLATTTNTTFGGKYEAVAGTGTTIADAAAINAASSCVLATGGNNAVGVKLPVAAAGKLIFLKNRDSDNGIMLVYPQVNSSINAIAANGSLSVAAKAAAVFMGTSATNWVTIPLLPS